MSESGSCPYCTAEQPDYDIEKLCCRTRFKYDHMGKFATSKRIEYEMRKDSWVLQVREEQEE